MRAARWSDGDRHLGPFTYGISDYRLWAVVLTSSGEGDSNDRPCQLRINLGMLYLIVVLPNIVRPHKVKVYPGWDAATIARLGRDWYWDVDPRSYGFSLSGCGDIGNSTFLQVHYGRHGDSCMDSSIRQCWNCFLPWTQWRFIRHSLYDLDGGHFYTEIESETRALRKLGGRYDKERRTIVESWTNMCPRAKFLFRDFDGELISATTRIDEREWRFGTGWFKWLSAFRRPKIQRSLHIEFSEETGKRKGSWKGGTIGHSIEMQIGELHEAAFRRYCQEHEMTFLEHANV